MVRKGTHTYMVVNAVTLLATYIIRFPDLYMLFDWACPIQYAVRTLWQSRLHQRPFIDMPRGNGRLLHA